MGISKEIGEVMITMQKIKIDKNVKIGREVLKFA